MKEIDAGLYDPSLEKVTVKELIEKLKELPQDSEIVIYPKYDEVNGYDRHRFRLCNIMEQINSRNGYEYCAIIF